VTRRSQKYDDALSAVRVIVNTHDPEGLLAMDAPEDEYDPEVTDLVRLVLRGNVLDPSDVEAIWTRWFGNDDGFRGERLRAVTADLQELHQRLRSSPDSED
jgi:hypothetical protein